MIKRLRMKFITVTMILVAVMLVLIFTLICANTQRDLLEDNLRLFHSLGKGSGLEHGPGHDPGFPSQLPNRCFVITQLPDGSIATQAGYSDIPDTATLEQILQLAIQADTQTDILYRYNLRFYRMEGTPDVSYAFMDISREMSAMWALVLNCIMIGGITLVLFFPISWLMARAITKPVEAAIAQQQQFVADASHELKTPLTVILTNAEMLQSQDYSPQDQQRFTDAIHTMALQMRHLVESLLDLARLDQGTRKRPAVSVDLSELAEECSLLFEPVYFEADRELLSQVEPGICLQGDSVKLQQLIDILLDNGCKYSDVGTQVTLHLQRQGAHHCLLQVSSRGETLTAQQCQDIFKRFYRVDTVRTGSGSYGLGLPIAQQIVQEHQGKIWCEGKEGVNIFYIQLPTIKQ